MKCLKMKRLQTNARARGGQGLRGVTVQQVQGIRNSDLRNPGIKGAPLRAVLGRSWGSLGRSWGRLGALWSPSWASLGPSWRPSIKKEKSVNLRCPLGARKIASWAPLGALLERSGALLGPSWASLGPLLGPSWAILEPSWATLGPSSATLGLLGAKGQEQKY